MNGSDARLGSPRLTESERYKSPHSRRWDLNPRRKPPHEPITFHASYHRYRRWPRSGQRLPSPSREKVQKSRSTTKQQSREALAAKLGDRTRAFQADVRNADDVQRLVDEVTTAFGSPTTVVHNALSDFEFNGDGRRSMRWRRLRSPCADGFKGRVESHTLPIVAKNGFGRFINIGTNLFPNPVVPYHDYTTIKASLLSVTAAAAELGPHGITVNMVSGGLLRTTDASAATPEAVFDYIAQSTPLRSVTTPAEMADAVLFFASPWSRAVTGQNLVVDGGLVFN